MSSHMSSESIDSTSTRSAWVPPLLWKEIRQVIPLITAVLLGGFGLLLMILVLSALTSKRSFSFDRSYWYLFLSMPMMYATGVGIMLVGTEKESRSLQWMRSSSKWSRSPADAEADFRVWSPEARLTFT
jgi:uncharacterized membrane protein YhaH (DUF805 family)